MQPFSYSRPPDAAAAIAAAHEANAKFLAGGTNLVELMRGGVETPARLIDIGRLPLSSIDERPDGGVRIGALARNSDVASHPLVRSRYPLLSQALLAGASPQLRNAATIGGNILQRTRCHYFCDTEVAMCNKREPGSGCAALEGHNRTHAIFGASEHCVATHPSDMCVALSALDALVCIQGAAGERTVSMMDFHRLPGDDPQLETRLVAGELIVAVNLPVSVFAEHSAYVKIQDSEECGFAIVSAAAAFAMSDGIVTDARIALGGVAHKPWRAFEAEQLLIDRVIGGDAFAEAAEAAVAGARPLKDNAFKVELARDAVLRALEKAAGPLAGAAAR